MRMTLHYHHLMKRQVTRLAADTIAFMATSVALAQNDFSPEASRLT